MNELQTIEVVNIHAYELLRRLVGERDRLKRALDQALQICHDPTLRRILERGLEG